MRLFLRTQFGPVDVMVCPALMKYISESLEKKQTVMKQIRKAREARALARK